MAKRRRNRLGTVLLSVIGPLALVSTPMCNLPGGGSGGSGSTTPVPTVTLVPPGSGQHGYPYDTVPTTPVIPGAPTIDLAARGYVQHEFLMSGTADEYQKSGTWGPNGRWSVSVSKPDVPYTTRLLVRYPTDPARFNGTVVVEWLNDTTGNDQDPVWAQTYDELMREGYAYVGVTAQMAGVSDLKAWDAQRYSSLSIADDSQSYGIFAQTAAAIRHRNGTLLGGLQPTTVLGTGDSQSALRLDTFANAFQPTTHAYDGLLAVGRAAVAAPLGNGLASLTPIPAYIRTDSRTPFIQLNSEGDVYELQSALARQPDSSVLRTWELAGASHIDAHEADYELAVMAFEVPSEPVPHCAFGTPAPGLPGVNAADSMPLYEVEDAAVAALQRWVTHGTPPPHAQPITTSPLFNVVQRDQYGNALGGIRLPEIQVPTMTYSAINFAAGSGQTVPSLAGTLQLLLTGGTNDPGAREAGLCLLSGYSVSLPTATLQQLYPTHADYVAKYTAAAQAAEAAGFLTPYDAAQAIARAEASSIP